MICNVNTTTWAEIDICYTAGQEIGNNATFQIAENGTPVDLSGIELEMQVKYKPEDPLTRAIIVFKTTDGTMTVGGVGNSYITLHGVYQVNGGDRFHDILRKDTTEYIAKGVFRIYANTTRN